MIVYVESNFILELALIQEEYYQCSELLSLAGQRCIQLVVPAFSIAEPSWTLKKNALHRESVHDDFIDVLRQLGRSIDFADFAERSAEVARVLLSVAQKEEGQLGKIVSKVLAVAEVVPLSGEILLEARQLRDTRGLATQDAIVFATVCQHLTESDVEVEKCFISRDSDFQNPDIVADLEALSCRLLSSFDDGLSHVTSRLGELDRQASQETAKSE